MKLAFKNKYRSGWTEKEVMIAINMGTIETLCMDNGLIFSDLGNDKKISSFDFRSELLYYGYITGCKDSYKKPEYTKTHAILWNEHLSESSRKELQEKLNIFYTGMEKITGVKKKVKQNTAVRPSVNSGPSHSGS